jgi:hypothetical protein
MPVRRVFIVRLLAGKPAIMADYVGAGAAFLKALPLTRLSTL